MSVRVKTVSVALFHQLFAVFRLRKSSIQSEKRDVHFSLAIKRLFLCATKCAKRRSYDHRGICTTSQQTSTRRSNKKAEIQFTNCKKVFTDTQAYRTYAYSQLSLSFTCAKRLLLPLCTSTFECIEHSDFATAPLPRWVVNTGPLSSRPLATCHMPCSQPFEAVI